MTAETLLPAALRSPADTSRLSPRWDGGLRGPRERGILLGSDELPCSQGEKTATLKKQIDLNEGFKLQGQAKK